MAQVKLLGAWFSPFVRRVEMALKMKGVEYEYIEQDLKNKSPLLLNYNPIHKQVPVLLHNGNTIVESLIILEYIDETWEGPTLLPKDPYERSKARFWAKYVDKCLDAMWKACWSRGEQRESAMDEAIEALKFLEKEIKGKKFFGGDKIGVVDIAANFIAHWFPIIQEVVGFKILTHDEFPNLCKWADEFCSDILVKDNLPGKDKLITSLKVAFESGSVY